MVCKHAGCRNTSQTSGRTKQVNSSEFGDNQKSSTRIISHASDISSCDSIGVKSNLLFCATNREFLFIELKLSGTKQRNGIRADLREQIIRSEHSSLHLSRSLSEHWPRRESDCFLIYDHYRKFVFVRESEHGPAWHSTHTHIHATKQNGNCNYPTR